jgi:F-type H+-transporting ATPase subunit gamma
MNLRQVRSKTKSVTNVKKITHAMEMVSAIKMKKAQQAEIEGRPYRLDLEKVVKKIVDRVDIKLSALLNPQAEAAEKKLAIMISSNKGLCGVFLMNLERFLLHQTDIKAYDFITVGKKGAVFLSGSRGKVLADFSLNNPLNDVSAIFTLAVNKFLDGSYSQVSIIYNKFISTFRSETVEEVILPLALKGVRADEEETKEDNFEYLIEPSPQQIIDPLLRTYIEEKIRGAIISSQAVEHSARMIAMKNATDNANDVIYSLTLLGNKLRQNTITSELLDMITAKESVETD